MQSPPRSVDACEISTTLFRLASDDKHGGGFKQVLCYEVDDAARAAEALEYTSSLAQSGLPGIPSELPEVIPPESIYASVGGDLELVEPVLAGRKVVICCYGGATICAQALQVLLSRSAEAMLKQAEVIATERLLRLGISMVEFSQEVSGQPVWTDLVSELSIDVSVTTDHILATASHQLRMEVLATIQEVLARRGTGIEGRPSCHYLLELSASHANDRGTLLLQFISSPSGSELPFHAHNPDCLHEHVACLQYMSEVLRQPRASFGACHEERTESSLLFLVPQPGAPFGQSLFSQVWTECYKLREEQPEVLAEHDDFFSRGQLPGYPPHMRASTSSLIPYKLDSPQRQSDHISWGSVTPDDSYDQLPRGAQLPPPSQRSTSENCFGTGSNFRPASAYRSESVPALSPRIWHDISHIEHFDVNAWCGSAQESGKPPQEQVDELRDIVVNMQHAVIFLLAQVRGPTYSKPIGVSTDGGSDRLQWSDSQGLPGSLRLERPAAGRAGSPRLSNGRFGAGGARLHTFHPSHSSSQCLRVATTGCGSPRLPGAEVEPLSPMTRSRSAHLPSGSMLNLSLQKGRSMILSLNSETASPKLPTRDISPTQARSGAQVKAPSIPTSASPPPPLHGIQQRNLIPHSLGPPSQVSAALSFPPPVQVPGTTKPPMDPHMMVSPRKLARTINPPDDGIRSPMPAPPPAQQQHAKALQPHSARSCASSSGLPVTMQQASGRSAVGMCCASGGLTDSSSHLRWEQSSPCRARYVAHGKAMASAPNMNQAAGRGTVMSPTKPVPLGVSTSGAVVPSLAAQFNEVQWRTGGYHPVVASSPTRVLRPS